MRNLILLIYSLQILFALSNSLAVETNEGQSIDEYGPAVVYIDQPLDAEEAEFANKQVNRLPQEDEHARQKRSLKKYKVLESPGLHSHFRIVQDEEVLKVNPHRRRYRRSTDKRSKSELHSDEVEDLDNIDTAKSKNEGSDFSIESVPNPQKQVGNPAHYRSDDSRTMDKWVKAPYSDFQARARKEEEDSNGESSSNVGIKTRTPRVNFITQQGQRSGSGNKDDIPDGPEARERERERERERDRDQQNNSNNNNNNNNKYDSNKYDNKQGNSDDSYRKPSNDRYYPPSYGNKYDTYDRPSYQPQYPSPYPPNYYNRDYPPPSQYNPYYDKYNPYYDRYYDRYNERNGMLPPPGMQRMTPPVGPSSSFYYRHQYNDYDDYIPRSVPNYYYSDKRFDTPMESREPFDPYRPYLYNNEVNKPGRIVYYANLPDVVRTPSNYRYASARYADSVPNYRDPNYYYDRDDYAARTAKSVNYRDVPASTTMRVSSTPVRSGTARDASYYG